MTEQREIMTIDEVAEYLRIHRMTVYRWAKAGTIPMFKVGGRGGWRARRTDITNYGNAVNA